MQRSKNFLSNPLVKIIFSALLVWNAPLSVASNVPGPQPRSEHNEDAGAYPVGPELSVTPGSLCGRASELRYAEKIKYCERSVDSSLKNDIIREYDQRFSYTVRSMPRTDFKIDHLIPLCAGGSNERNNLWPQHKSVYVKTDRIEETLCRLMQNGKIHQDEAVDIVLDVKQHLETSDAVLKQLLAQL